VPTQPSSAHQAYRAARDRLLEVREDYDRAVAEHAWPDVGERFCWAVDWFDEFARGNDRPGLVISGRDGSVLRRSFDDLAVRSDRLAAWLAGQGVGVGDPVLLMLGNQVELWETMLAVMKLGAVVLPTTTAVGPADLTDRVARGHVRAVVCNPADAGKFEQVPGEYVRVSVGPAGAGWQDLREGYAAEAPPAAHPGTAPSDPQLLYFTSGTTSRPKLVEHTQVSYPVGHLSTAYWIGVQPGDMHLNISSPGWGKHAWSSFFAAWIAEATVLVLDYDRFDPEVLLNRLREHHVTTFCAPPTVWRMLVNADLSAGRPPDLREVLSAGEPLNPEVIAQVERRWGLTIRDGYGQTETTALIGNTPGSTVRPGSMGRPLPGAPVLLVDPVTEQPVAGAGEGEICLDLAERPLLLMAGYADDLERQADATAGGFYHTGDIASRDEDGYITYVGRTDDVFKASDYKISPFELESVLIEHPAVVEAAVVPAPDPVRLAVPKAYVSLAAGYEPTRETALSILQHARGHLAPYQRIRRLEFFELPKTISGKIRRVELRDRENAEHPKDYRAEDFPELRDPTSESRW
jgi:acetyl-CoA synthetase